METRLTQTVPLCVRWLHFTPSVNLEPDFRLIWQRCGDFTTGASGVCVNRCACIEQKLLTLSNGKTVTVPLHTEQDTKISELERDYAYGKSCLEICCESGLFVHVLIEVSQPFILFDNLVSVDSKNTLSFPWCCQMVRLGRERGDSPGCWRCPDHHSTLPASSLTDLNGCLKDTLILVFSFWF